MAEFGLYVEPKTTLIGKEADRQIHDVFCTGSNNKTSCTAITAANCANGHKEVTNRRAEKGGSIRHMQSN